MALEQTAQQNAGKFIVQVQDQNRVPMFYDT